LYSLGKDRYADNVRRERVPGGTGRRAMAADRFSGRTVMVTGAARGQGRAFALAFASEGADVAICDVGSSCLATVDYALASADDLASVAAEVKDLGRRALARVCDIRDQEQVNAFVRAAI